MIDQFPITPYLDEICKALRDSPSRFLILTAETAAGKSTILPKALLEHFSGKIIMTEPRRIAVLGVANRLAELCETDGGKPGERNNPVGYKIHLENNIGKNYVDFTQIKTGIRDKVGKYLYEETECKPMILVVVQEV